MVVDLYGNVVRANRASRCLLGDDIVGINLVRRFLADPSARPAIANWPEVAGPAWTGSVTSSTGRPSNSGPACTRIGVCGPDRAGPAARGSRRPSYRSRLMAPPGRGAGCLLL